MSWVSTLQCLLFFPVAFVYWVYSLKPLRRSVFLLRRPQWKIPREPFHRRKNWELHVMALIPP